MKAIHTTLSSKVGRGYFEASRFIFWNLLLAMLLSGLLLLVYLKKILFDF